MAGPAGQVGGEGARVLGVVEDQQPAVVGPEFGGEGLPGLGGGRGGGGDAEAAVQGVDGDGPAGGEAAAEAEQQVVAAGEGGAPVGDVPHPGGAAAGQLRAGRGGGRRGPAGEGRGAGGAARSGDGGEQGGAGASSRRSGTIRPRAASTAVHSSAVNRSGSKVGSGEQRDHPAVRERLVRLADEVLAHRPVPVVQFDRVAGLHQLPADPLGPGAVGAGVADEAVDPPRATLVDHAAPCLLAGPRPAVGRPSADLRIICRRVNSSGKDGV